GRKILSFDWEGLDAKMTGNRYLNQEGNLAGAAISMPEAVNNAITHLRLSLQEAVEMATSRVARALQMDNKIGFIKSGMPARFCVFDNENVLNANSMIV
ncbi:MAG TPA: amidohydrolase family protein, partial [Arachidicoccus sp.]